MIARWMQWLGIEGQRVADAELVGLFFTRPNLFWLALIVVLPLMVWVVWRQRRALAERGKAPAILLALTRCALLLAAAVLLGGPALQYEAAVEDQPIAAVLIDTSASMDLRVGNLDQAETVAWYQAMGGEPIDSDDRNFFSKLKERTRGMWGLARAEVTRRALDHQLDTLRDTLGESVELRVYFFDSEARPVELDQVVPALHDLDPDRPGADGSDVYAAVQRVVRDAAGRPIAGVLVIGDGQFAGRDELDSALDPRAGGDGLSGLAVWTLPAGGKVPAADVWVADVIVPPRVSVGEDAAVVVTVDGRGVPDESLTVQLKRGAQVLDTRQLRRSDLGKPRELTFTPGTVGLERLTVEVLPFTDEKVVSNNSQPVRVEVDDRRIKLLYLDGSSSWDFRFLNRAFERDPGIEMTLLSSWPLRTAGVLPADLAGRMGVPDSVDAFAEYDAVLLGDVSGAVLPDERQQALLQAVRERGVGLIIQCGPTGTPADFVGRPLAGAFPTRLGSMSRQPVEPDGAWALGLDVTPVGAVHPAFRLTSDVQQTRAAWRDMPGFYWAARLGELRPGAQALAEAVDPRERRVPLIASHTLERGQVVVIGTDATYRWRRNRGDTIFYRFWGQLIRATARSDDPTDRTWLRARPLVAQVGEPVAIELFSKPAVSQPTESVTVQVAGESLDEPTTLKLRSGNQPGRYEAVWVPTAGGTLTLTHTDASGTTATAEVDIQPSHREFDRIHIDHDGLAKLAQATGGEAIGPEGIADWADQLDPTFAAASERFERPAWDHWLTLLVITLVYSVDITTRRLNGLQ